MNHSANLRTKARPRSVWLIGRSTTLTYLQGAPDRRIPAGTRAVFDGTEGSFPRVELAAAVSAGRCAAVIANESCPGSRRKLFTAGTAVTNRRTVREATVPKKFGVGLPKVSLFAAVTGRTERYEVVQNIGIPVVAKQAERSDVMDRKTWLRSAAPLACVVVSPSRCSTLPDPVLASIANVTTKPSRVVFAAPRRGCAPLSEARTVTEVVRLDGAGHLLNRTTAGRTGNLHSVQPYTFSVNPLPRSVASKPTKRVFGHDNVIRLSLNSDPALNTSNSDHTKLYHVWPVANGGHFA